MVPCVSHDSLDLEPSGYAPSQARRMVRQVVTGLVTPDVAHTAELLVSELVTNAITHGSGTVRLSVDCASHCLSVVVSDDDPESPQVQPEKLMSTGGRGLQMMESLASAWGVSPRSDGPGKDVWFRLP